jgi:hypothetical protein
LPRVVADEPQPPEGQDPSKHDLAGRVHHSRKFYVNDDAQRLASEFFDAWQLDATSCPSHQPDKLLGLDGQTYTHSSQLAADISAGRLAQYCPGHVVLLPALKLRTVLPFTAPAPVPRGVNNKQRRGVIAHRSSGSGGSGGGKSGSTATATVSNGRASAGHSGDCTGGSSSGEEDNGSTLQVDKKAKKQALGGSRELLTHGWIYDVETCCPVGMKAFKNGPYAQHGYAIQTVAMQHCQDPGRALDMSE